jgi:hypothetical protein
MELSLINLLANIAVVLMGLESLGRYITKHIPAFCRYVIKIVISVILWILKKVRNK